MNQYIIDYKGQSLEELVNQINHLDGLPLSEMKVQDLVFNCLDGSPIRTGNGVYIFKNYEKTFYIGNCVARNFVERVPAHFDIRYNGWFNSLLKAIIKSGSIGHKNAQDVDLCLQESAKFAFENINIILINFIEYDKTKINNLENQLAKKLCPMNKHFRRIININT